MFTPPPLKPSGLGSSFELSLELFVVGCWLASLSRASLKSAEENTTRFGRTGRGWITLDWVGGMIFIIDIFLIRSNALLVCFETGIGMRDVKMAGRVTETYVVVVRKGGEHGR